METIGGSSPSSGIGMIFGLDFDGTYTRAPELWNRFIEAALGEGHLVVLVTNRPDDAEHHGVVASWTGGRIPAFFTNGRPKRQVALEAGYDVDVWIDDNPILVDYGAAGLSMVGFCR